MKHSTFLVLAFLAFLLLVSSFWLSRSSEVYTPLSGVELDVLEALSQRDFAALAGFVHREKGVLFSPYASVDTVGSTTMNSDELSPAWENGEQLMWGIQDGSGEPILLTFPGYFDRFIWDHDYRAAEKVTYNELREQGNSINNLAEAFPGAEFVEFYFSGFDPQYGGMDWKALTLVFERVGVDLKLVGIVHSEWTI